VRKLFAAWLLLAAGCTTPTAGTEAGPQDLGGIASHVLPVPPPPVPVARVGVEYLPPEPPDRDFLASPLELAPPVQKDLPDRDPPAARPPLPRWGYRPSPEIHNRTGSAELVASLDLSKERIRTVENTSERLGLRFLREVLGHDHQRVRRALGGALETGQAGYVSSLKVPTTYVDERDQEDFLVRVKRYGTRLLRKPARRALKELAIVSDVEQTLNEFKAVHIPLTGAYQRRHNKTHRGRFSMHLGRGSSSTDPIEIYYLRSGWKIGGGIDNGRIIYSRYLTKNVRVRLRSSFDYDDQDVKLLGTLALEVSPQTTLNLMAGNDMTVLTGPTTYLGTPPDEESSQAVAFYVEHLF
jgi:hypothetical protein